MVRKRRSLGASTDRDTWVRIARRGLDRIGVQGGDGTASAEALLRITKPAWLAGVAWRDETEAVMWRADETAAGAAGGQRRAGGGSAAVR